MGKTTKTTKTTKAPVPPAANSAAIDRLLWRAGFGPSAADRKRFGRKGVPAAVELLLNPAGSQLPGAALRWKDDDGATRPIAVSDDGKDWAIEVLWWLDRMVRTRAPLVERMTLNLHDHFATSNEKVNSREKMVAQNELLRAHALGNFGTLAKALVRDHAMQEWLDLTNSDKSSPNENFARELMELFTIGLTYTQRDVTEMARAFTGFTFDWDSKQYGYDAERHDDGVKTIFGQRGNFGPGEAIDLCLAHPAHAPFLCTKLWNYFVPTPPPAARLKAMTAAYVGSKFELKPVLRIILNAPELYRHLEQPDMVKPPAVYLAGALRATGVRTLLGSYRWLLDSMGQQPFYPPNVAGWDQGEAFLTTGSIKARWEAMGHVLEQRPIAEGSLPMTQPPEVTLAAAMKATGQPWVSARSRTTLQKTARAIRPQWKDDKHAVCERRRVLQHLLLAGPDAQVH